MLLAEIKSKYENIWEKKKFRHSCHRLQSEKVFVFRQSRSDAASLWGRQLVFLFCVGNILAIFSTVPRSPDPITNFKSWIFTIILGLIYVCFFFMQTKPKITPNKMRRAMNLIRQCYDQPPTQAGPTARRNFIDLTRSTWLRMVREELGLRAYRVCNKHKYIFESSFDIRKKTKCCFIISCSYIHIVIVSM